MANNISTDNVSETSRGGLAFDNDSSDNEGFANHPHLEENMNHADQTAAGSDSSLFGADFGQILGGLGDLRARGSDAISAINQTARANPWLGIGLAGAGALALGFFIGRATNGMTAGQQAPQMKRDEDLQGYAE